MGTMDEVHKEAMADYRSVSGYRDRDGAVRRLKVERTRRDYIDSGKADQDARVDRGEYAACGVEYEGVWLERQETRETTA